MVGVLRLVGDVPSTVLPLSVLVLAVLFSAVRSLVTVLLVAGSCPGVVPVRSEQHAQHAQHASSEHLCLLSAHNVLQHNINAAPGYTIILL